MAKALFGQTGLMERGSVPRTSWGAFGPDNRLIAERNALRRREIELLAEIATLKTTTEVQLPADPEQATEIGGTAISAVQQGEAIAPDHIPQAVLDGQLVDSAAIQG